MAQSKIDPATLSAFENAAAGHDGVLSDPSGELVIKPCTTAEIAFYESANAEHGALAAYMPTFMGTLQLDATASSAAAVDSATAAAPAIPEAGAAAKDSVLGGSFGETGGMAGKMGGVDSKAAWQQQPQQQAEEEEKEAAPGTAATLKPDDPGPMKGKKLDTETSIVLANAAAGFARPNILDLKLGARLYDDDAAPAKRARLDKVAAETTSSSLGFRVAGMRVWQGAPTPAQQGADAPRATATETDQFATLDRTSGYKTFNKLYGRAFSADSVRDAFREFLVVRAAGVGPAAARKTTQRFLADVKAVRAVLEREESRMYSASLLFVYEGDAEAALELRDAARKAEGDVQTATSSGAKGWNEEDDDEVDVDVDDEDEDEPKLAVVKLIDFAHAAWTPGQGPDENLLRGVRSIQKLLEEMEEELAKEAE
ncbi:uncharacterized protein K452DRAFT_285824 [Aplosporella prunicola CBS 121167]|uniref:Kinase n=1 Tax=Aplosporella prunicola CBS 121167 TaxID=1176127 RepID=A0A6A6BJI5_9PEZI|nr:uncharacterized protein K452DRAFT_285824 [Aplosporella prunicola CBS 121167]KAF2143788.1 hypothetical protein K452DRAFT_285824 [Aplosporella prunicola CBS 121167]